MPRGYPWFRLSLDLREDPFRPTDWIEFDISRAPNNGYAIRIPHSEDPSVTEVGNESELIDIVSSLPSKLALVLLLRGTEGVSRFSRLHRMMQFRLREVEALAAPNQEYFPCSR